MEPLTTAILARGIYDLLQSGVAFTKDMIKEKLKQFIADQIVVNELADKIETLPLDDEMSHKAIERRLNESEEIIATLKSVPASSVVNITQTHSGTGDNVGGNKVINGNG
ncbi:GapS6a family protein [Pantoea ananatis]|uniref:GapS6a family protein n=1 Tax=Pantoea ananas TaxID=553 RepID=UPI001B3139D8|nr:hypothetical protein [Pantoea ananatis]